MGVNVGVGVGKCGYSKWVGVGVSVHVCES